MKASSARSTGWCVNSRSVFVLKPQIRNYIKRTRKIDQGGPARAPLHVRPVRIKRRSKRRDSRTDYADWSIGYLVSFLIGWFSQAHDKTVIDRSVSSPSRVTVAVFVARLMDACPTPATAARAAFPLDTHPPHCDISWHRRDLRGARRESKTEACLQNRLTYRVTRGRTLGTKLRKCVRQEEEAEADV